jgi:ferrous iron transport protein B
LAKEAVVSTMGVLYKAKGYDVDEQNNDSTTSDNEESVTTALAANSVFTPLTAISFLVFNLLVIPCFAAVATARSELKSVKWTFFVIFFWFVTAWTTSFLVYQIGSLLKGVNWINLITGVFIVGIILFAIFRRKSKKNDKCNGCDKCPKGRM